MRRHGLLIVAALVLASCASDAEYNTGKTPPAPPPAAAQPPPPPPLPPPPATPKPAPAQSPAPDSCGANALQSLIGRPRTEIPVPLNPSKRRVVCTTCPMTRDFRPDRLTILFDAATGRITKLMCQ